MPRCICARVPGGTFYFTVALLERRRQLLAERIDDLRAVFAQARRRRPFIIDAMVVLPDHLHCIWTLPAGDNDFSGRRQDSKARFSARIAPGERTFPRGGSARARIVRTIAPRGPPASVHAFLSRRLQGIFQAIRHKNVSPVTRGLDTTARQNQRLHPYCPESGLRPRDGRRRAISSCLKPRKLGRVCFFRPRCAG